MRTAVLVPLTFLLMSPFGVFSASAFASVGEIHPRTLATFPMLNKNVIHPAVQRHRTGSLQKTTKLESFNWIVALRGGGEVISDDTFAMEAFEWCSNLGAPAALVAGAVLATLSQTRQDLSPRRTDKRWIRLAKKTCRALLLSSFALEIFCIFVTTVTGTMLLSHGDSPAGAHAGIHYHSPMGFLNHNHEFEYLTSRVTFLQGLLNWLLAVALDVYVPKEGESVAARKMNLFISTSLVSMILLMVKFYNDHMTFYDNYFEMLYRYCVVTFQRFFWNFPPRPLSLIVTPWIIASMYNGWNAFSSPPDLDD